jgi:hypothetical protein
MRFNPHWENYISVKSRLLLDPDVCIALRETYRWFIIQVCLGEHWVTSYYCIFPSIWVTMHIAEENIRVWVGFEPSSLMLTDKHSIPDWAKGNIRTGSIQNYLGWRHSVKLRLTPGYMARISCRRYSQYRIAVSSVTQLEISFETTLTSGLQSQESPEMSFHYCGNLQICDFMECLFIFQSCIPAATIPLSSNLSLFSYSKILGKKMLDILS